MRQWLGLMAELNGLPSVAWPRPDRPPEHKARLQDAHDMFSMMEESMPDLLERLEQDRRNGEEKTS